MSPKDVSEADFQREVLERSNDRPVVVDFWAAWCAPCRHLGPVLERVAERHDGEIELVKVDVDANPMLANRYGIQGIPAVKAFRNGGVVDEFVGNYPEEAVRMFFDALAPTEADRLAAAAADSDGDPAEALYRRALELDRDHRASIVGLAELLIDRGEFEEARSFLARLPEDAEIRRLRARADLAEATGEAAPDDPLAAASADGDWEPALARLLEEVRNGDRERARQQMVDIFELLGPEDPLSVKYRSALAAALF